MGIMIFSVIAIKLYIIKLILNFKTRTIVIYKNIINL